jgi:uncharacterized protein (DUF736 family)
MNNTHRNNCAPLNVSVALDISPADMRDERPAPQFRTGQRCANSFGLGARTSSLFF